MVSNACGTLWNLSARDVKDQELLWELGAVGMLRNLIHSRHKMIAMGSAAALRNLMANRPARYKDASVMSPGGGAPSLQARKQKALFEELDAQQLSETFDNIDNLSPKAAHRKGRGSNRSFANTPVLSSPKGADGSKRPEEGAYPRAVFPPSVRASSDSLNSVTSVDGYGNRGKTKPSSETFYSSDESGNKCCVYRKYPADLAHKIRSANHMDDDGGAELDTPINYSLKYSDEQLNSGRQSPSRRGSDDRQKNEASRRNDGESAGGHNAPPPHFAVSAPSANYGSDVAAEQPIDYSLKYGETARKPLEKAPPPLRLRPVANKLRPPPGRAKSHLEAPQTYCVEDTPICFSRGSSLSSLSSEDEADGRKRTGSVHHALPVGEKDSQQRLKEAESQTASVPSTRGRRGHHHHHHATPKSPPEPPFAQETPLMFSRCTSVSSLDSFSTSSIASSVRSSEPCSGVPSGVVSPSDLPDSPGQTMPPSRAKTPPPPLLLPVQKPLKEEKKEDESGADILLHFATESTPHGFSRASSLSALSVDEPFIATEMKASPEPAASDDDDDIEILEACINMAMPKSSRKSKKQTPPPPPPPPPPHKPSQLPVYKLLPPQSRSQSQLRKDVLTEEVPRVYCVEGTPLNFSTATSLSDLTIESPPNEEAAPLAPPPSGRPDGDNGDDILAECINAAMPKPKKTARPPANADFLQTPPSPPVVPPPPPPVAPPPPAISPPPPAAAPPPAGLQKKKPTSPVKPMPPRLHAISKTKPGFSFDSPRNYTPIEGTPCCFSRNDSLSSLDFDEDDGDADRKAKEDEGRRRRQQTAAVLPRTKAANGAEEKRFSVEDTPLCFSRKSSVSSLSDIDHENNNKAPSAKQAPPPQVELKPRPSAGYAPRAFHVEDTPVCFSRNSSLSSLSIDSEDDLLQECISSAMPKKKKAAASLPAAAANESAPEEAPRSPASPDSESFDWKAIQEGANSIVSSLHAAASSLSRQPSSDSDSVLSLKSVGSPLHLPTVCSQGVEPEARGGARILKSGEQSTSEQKKKEDDEGKALRGHKKVYCSPITGKPRPDTAARGRSKPRGGGAPRESPPTRSIAANQKTGKLSHFPRTSSPGSTSSSKAGKPSGPGLRSDSSSRVAAKKARPEPERPPLVRQSTFIKDAPSPPLKRKLEESSPSVLSSPSSPDTPLPLASKKTEAGRSHSESPSRPPDSDSSRPHRTGTWKREHGGAASAGKHSTSLPRIGTWKRTGSSSSILSASSESSERGQSQEDSQGRSQEESQGRSQEDSGKWKGTWRKGRNDPSVDVWVRLEDCPVNNPRPSSSCSARSPSSKTPPVIDGPAPSNLNLRGSSESLDEKPSLERQQLRAQQRGGAVAARVSPFNYTPSPRKNAADVGVAATTAVTSSAPLRPSLIPTPVNKKREAKGDGGDGGERGSYIVTSV